ncbi:MAG TPA: lipopolysaccharide biosynthesis protein [Alphaproteobacteria bacterium]|nr:lipopolysaccharide biosynthesis protein [Alphaproteobacteria bacterium]
MTLSNQKSFAEACVSGLKWNYAGAVIRALSSMVITIVLARLLGPEPFGLVAIAWIVVGLGNLVADLGLGPALVQRTTISDADVRYTFTMQVCMGLALMTVVALSAPVLTVIFQQPKVVPVVRALSCLFVLQTFGVVAVALLTRAMDFRGIQSARIASYLVGFLALGIPLALLGLEVWSLVIAQLAQAAVFSILSYRQVRHPLTPLFRATSRGVNSFGLKVLSTNLVNYAISSLDSFFIGRFFDVVILGLYNRAFILVSTPINTLVITVQKVLFPAYSQMQHDPQTVRRAHLAGVGFMAMVMVPVYGCVAVVPGTIIAGLFGPEWADAIPFLVPLALAMPFHAIMATGGPMLWAKNLVGRELIAQLCTACIFLAILVVTARVSATALVWGVFVGTVARFVLITHASLRTVGASWSSLLRSASGSLVLLVPTAGVVFFTNQIIAEWHVAPFPLLAADILVGTGVVVGVILWVPQLVFSQEMCWLADHLMDRLPGPVRMLMHRGALRPSVLGQSLDG